MKRLSHHFSALPALASLLLISSCMRHEQVAVIPVPKSFKTGAGSFVFSCQTVISVETQEQKTIADSFAWLFAEPAGFVPKVLPGEKDSDMSLITDPEMEEEAYSIEVSRKHIVVKASSIAGFAYALQTLRQTLPVELSSTGYAGNIRWEVPVMTVHDKPRFSHRCLMLDLEHCGPDNEWIFFILDCMTMLKFNYLHLYSESDSCSQRIERIMKYASDRSINVILDDHAELVKEYGTEPQWLEPLVSFGNKSLKDIYYYEPLDGDETEDFHGFLMGMLASSWINSCSCSEDMESQLLPRLAALAEIAWSPAGSKDWTRFNISMQKFKIHSKTPCFSLKN